MHACVFILYPSSSPIPCASYSCKCNHSCSPPTNRGSPPYTEAHSRFAPFARSDPPTHTIHWFVWSIISECMWYIFRIKLLAFPVPMLWYVRWVTKGPHKLNILQIVSFIKCNQLVIFIAIITQNNVNINVYVAISTSPFNPFNLYVLLLPSSVAGTNMEERLWAQMHNTHLLYPGSQVWWALIEASVLDEMFLALRAHNAAVIPVEVIQVGVIVVGFCAGVCRATCIVTPGSTLNKEGEKKGSALLYRLLWNVWINCDNIIRNF